MTIAATVSRLNQELPSAPKPANATTFLLSVHIATTALPANALASRVLAGAPNLRAAFRFLRVAKHMTIAENV